MLAFAPPHHHTLSPRDKYLSALADAKAAEAEYVASLRREQESLCRQREEAFSRQHEEVLRRQLLLNQLYTIDKQSGHGYSQYSSLYPQATLHRPCAAYADSFDWRYEREAQRRYARAQRQQQEELKRRRAEQYAKRRQEEERQLQHVLNLLSGIKPVPERRPQPDHRRVPQPNPGQVSVDFQEFLDLLSGHVHAQPATKAPAVVGNQSSGRDLRSAEHISKQPPVQRQNAVRQNRPRANAVSGTSTTEPAQVNQSQSVPSPDAAPTPAPGPSRTTPELKERLANRLHAEPEAEVRDALQSLLASIFGFSAPAAPTTPAPAEALTTTPSADAKGKGKAKAEEKKETQAPVDTATALQTIHEVDSALDALRGEFVFPSSLDFSPSSSSPSSPSASPSPIPFQPPSIEGEAKLAYTSTNAPLLHYEHSLGSLLSRLDAVESGGEEEVRRERKVVVGRVEDALEEVEREVKGRWGVWMGRKVQEESERAQSADGTTTSGDNGPAAAQQPVPSTITDATKVAVAEDINIVTTPVESTTTTTTSPVEASPIAEEIAAAVHPEAPAALEEPQLVVVDLVKPAVDPSQLSTLEGLSPGAAEDVELGASTASVKEALPTVEDINVTMGVSAETATLLEAITPVTDDVPMEAASTTEGIVERTLASSSVETTASQEAAEPPAFEHPSTDTEPTSFEEKQEVSDPVDTFLLPSSPTDSPPARASLPGGDDEVVVVVEEGSDWSEVEA